MQVERQSKKNRLLFRYWFNQFILTPIQTDYQGAILDKLLFPSTDTRMSISLLVSFAASHLWVGTAYSGTTHDGFDTES